MGVYRSIWIGELSKEDDPPQYRWASTNPLKDYIEKKKKGREKLNSLCAWLMELRFQSPFALGTLASQAFRFRLELTPALSSQAPKVHHRFP